MKRRFTIRGLNEGDEFTIAIAGAEGFPIRGQYKHGIVSVWRMDEGWDEDEDFAEVTS